MKEKERGEKRREERREKRVEEERERETWKRGGYQTQREKISENA